MMNSLRGPFDSSNAVRILVVDDDSTLRTVISRSLSRRGLTDIMTAVDGRDALDYLCSGQTVDCVLTDIDMPRMNGLQLIEAMGADQRLQYVPVLAMSGLAKNEYAALNSGADAFLPKGVDMDQVVECIKRIIAEKADARAWANTIPGDEPAQRF